MRERLLIGLASIRVRLIVTYVLVAAFSFLIINLLFMRPVERFLLHREEDNLAWIAHTLGTTISTPWKNEDAWTKDLYWNQRRCHDLAPSLGARIRLLDAKGQVLTDSLCRGTHHATGGGHNPEDDPRCNWNAEVWKRELAFYPNVSDRSEVRSAMTGQYGAAMRAAEENAKGLYSIYVAYPVLRTIPGAKEKRVAFILYTNKPVSSVRAVLHTLRHLLNLATIAGLLVAVLVSIALSNNLSSGLRSATRIAQAFAAGQMTLRMRETGRDELGQLGAAFNQMADALHRHEQLRRDLLADVSHELRTPLTAISGCADTLTDGALRDDPANAEHFLGIIAKESDRLQRLVTDILELSKLQAGAVEIPRRPMPICPVVDDAVEIARMHAASEGLSIHYDFPAEDDAPLLVLGNEDRLAQALRNLLDNARHHTGNGKCVTVTVEADDAWVLVHVRDEGEGISPEDLPWVFDRFYRAGKGGKVGGTGLGLAIVREIMQAHEGKVTVESTVGQGTTFSLHLPRVQAEMGVA